MSPCQRQASGPMLRYISATLGLILLTCSALPGVQPITQQTEFFESKVRPLLAQNCYQCHSEQAKILYSNLRVDGRVALLNGGALAGPAIVPGDPNSSQLIQAVRYENLEMPPAGRLSAGSDRGCWSNGSRWVHPGRILELAGGAKTSQGTDAT